MMNREGTYLLAQTNSTQKLPTETVKTRSSKGEISEWNPWLIYFAGPSEHTFEGRHMDLEMGFIHRTPEGITDEEAWGG